MADSSGFFDRLAALTRDGRPFAIATVVSRRAPVSAHLGDRAIVHADGRMDGFVGGACAREIIRKQALEALAARSARLVCIRPDATDAGATMPDRVTVSMTCASEGAVDVFVEPVLRPRSIVVAGATPVAEAVARVASAMRYAVVRVVEERERRDVVADASVRVEPLERLPAVLLEATSDRGECAAVVASQGHYDEAALEAILQSGVSYAGLVASRKRGQAVRTWLGETGVPGLDRLRNPAGLDLGARTPEEIAVSILGEIVQLGLGSPMAAGSADVHDAPGPPPAPAAAVAATTAVDPVCHMEVDVEGAAHTAELDGITYYFCCGGCRARFVKDPQRYVGTAS